jgi:DNA-binding HxlR family transcriptional regulator
MKSKKTDVRNIVLQPYVVDLLRELKSPKRFNDLMKVIKNKGTLTIKLSKMKEFGLIKTMPIKVDDNYANSYVISERGKLILKKLEEIKW